MSSESIKQIKETLKKPTPKEIPVEFITTGSTMLNLALSGKGVDGGWARGRIANLVALGSAGKSLIALETAANFYYNMEGNESINFPKVKTPIVIYNNVETVMDFPVSDMYGEEFKNNITWKNIPTIEETGRDFANYVFTLKKGESLLYVIDSWDALKTQENIEEFEKAAKTNTKEKSGFNLNKQKYGTQQFFPNICTVMEKKDVTLLIISQVRDKIGVSYGPTQTRTGGMALDFYTHQVCWFRQTEKLKKQVKGRERIYGTKVEADIKRNKVAKPYRKASFTILFDYGVDDISSMLDWYFGPKKALPSDIDFFPIKFPKNTKVTRKFLLDFIEENNYEDLLKEEITKEWLRIEDSFKTNRKKKF